MVKDALEVVIETGTSVSSARAIRSTGSKISMVVAFGSGGGGSGVTVKLSRTSERQECQSGFGLSLFTPPDRAK